MTEGETLYERTLVARFVGGDAHAVERSGTSTLGVHRPAVLQKHSLRCSVGADDPVSPNTAQRRHSEPVTDVTGVGIRPRRARRRGNPRLPL